MRKIIYSRLYNNDIRIVYNVLLNNKELCQNNFDNDIAFVKKKLLTFVISNIIIKLEACFLREFYLNLIMILPEIDVN